MPGHVGKYRHHVDDLDGVALHVCVCVETPTLTYPHAALEMNSKLWEKMDAKFRIAAHASFSRRFQLPL